MKVQRRPHVIAVSIVDGVEISSREAGFLRDMAKFCIEHNMAGNVACQRLVELLDAANVPPLPDGPVYGIFEEQS